MNINNLNTYSKPSLSIAAMCLAQLNGPASGSSQFDAKLKLVNTKSKYVSRTGEKIGIKNVALLENMGQSKVGHIFNSVGFDPIKAYKLIDAHKARVKLLRKK